MIKLVYLRNNDISPVLPIVNPLGTIATGHLYWKRVSAIGSPSGLFLFCCPTPQKPVRSLFSFSHLPWGLSHQHLASAAPRSIIVSVHSLWKTLRPWRIALGRPFRSGSSSFPFSSERSFFLPGNKGKDIDHPGLNFIIVKWQIDNRALLIRWFHFSYPSCLYPCHTLSQKCHGEAEMSWSDPVFLDLKWYPPYGMLTKQ